MHREPARIDQPSKNPVTVDLRNQPGTSNAVLSPLADIFEPVLPATNLGSEVQAPPKRVLIEHNRGETSTLATANLKLALIAMNSISDAIDNDLQSLENDVASGFESHGEGYVLELKVLWRHRPTHQYGLQGSG